MENYLRYTNDTMACLMFNAKLRKMVYNHIQSVIDNQTKLYVGAATMAYLTALSWTIYALRYITLNNLQCILVGTDLDFGLQDVDSIENKLLVD